MSNRSLSDVESIEEPSELQMLNNQLLKEENIKEGAEKMLNLPLSHGLRTQVERELDSAQRNIESISKKISNMQPQAKAPNPTNSAINLADDSRGVISNALSHLNTLLSLSKPPNQSPTKTFSPPLNSSSQSVSSSATDIDNIMIDTMSKLIRLTKRNLRVRYELAIVDVIQAAVPALADARSKQCRATAYRLIRHWLVDADSVKRLREQQIDWYIVKSLSRDNKHALEKEQVIKLIRAIVDVGSSQNYTRAAVGMGTVNLSEAVMRAMIAISEHAEDPFRPICIQTLVEICLIDIDLIARTGGIRFLLHSITDGPPELGQLIVATFLNLVDLPHTRAYLHVGSSLEIAISGITDAYGKGSDHIDEMKACAKVVQLMLQTWSGLMYLSMNDMAAIRSIINTLQIPSLENREIVLDMFFELLNIKTPSWTKTFIDGRRLTLYRKSQHEAAMATKPTHDPGVAERPPVTMKLTEQYMGLLVVVLTRAGLIQALTSIFTEAPTGSSITRKATLLLSEVLHIANRVLPLWSAAELQAVPDIFGLAADYKRGENRMIGTLALSAIDSLNRNKARLQPDVLPGFRPRAGSLVDDVVRRGHRQTEQIKLNHGIQMDDRAFQAMMLETQVMQNIKDHTKWNLDVLIELVEGPLLSPKRMEEAIKGSRFVRRLMTFFHPFNYRFSEIEDSKFNHSWIRLGCSLLTTLLSSPEGVRFLSEDDLLKQISEAFTQLAAPEATHSNQPLFFTTERLTQRLAHGYMDMVGTLSQQREGIELMEKWKIFTAFYQVTELRNRGDIIKSIIEHLDYSIDSHARIVLSKALSTTTSYKQTRLFATKHLGDLIRASPQANKWTLRLLLTQLYDPELEVRRTAVRLLEEACETPEILDTVVDMGPTMDHLGEIGHGLLLKFMTAPVGFRYLYDSGYINREIDSWFHERNIHYVVQVETFLSQVFSPNAPKRPTSQSIERAVPPHFYGEMSKTDLGCQVLQQKGHFAEFTQFIRKHGMESEDPDLIMKLKSVLWAVGNIGASENGLPFLEEDEIVHFLLQIAEESPVPSVRGTCFFVLGLISSTTLGAEILSDLQWEAVLTPMGEPVGLCIPYDLEKFISIPTWQPVPMAPDDRLTPPTSEVEIEVLTAIHNLANTVIANAASRTLSRLKARSEYKAVFSSTTMFYRALHAISTQRFKLPVRRYILDLFDIPLDNNIVQTLLGAEKALHAPISPSVPKLQPRRVLSILGRPPRRRQTESDEEEDIVDEKVVMEERPTISLRPVSRIVGFEK